MRTTLTIDDDLIAAARSFAQARSESLGKAALSDLARRGLNAAPGARRARSTSGFPVFVVPVGGAHPITLEGVRKAEDEQ